MFCTFLNGLIMGLGQPFKSWTFKTLKCTFLVRFSDHYPKTEPFDNLTCLDHLNTRLVWYSDGCCSAQMVRVLETIKIPYQKFLVFECLVFGGFALFSDYLVIRLPVVWSLTRMHGCKENIRIELGVLFGHDHLSWKNNTFGK